MLGGSMAGFAISLFVLDYTSSPAFYAIFIFLHTLPQIAAPLLAGPLMDRFSRRRTIYMLDFTSAAVYLTLAVIIMTGRFSFPILAAATFIIGTIDSTYYVAYDSFYPLLITKGNYSKAYSISGTLQTLTAIMIPVATLFYKAFGIYPLLFFNSACFLTAALFETRISDVEKYLDTEIRYSAKRYWQDTKDGFIYLMSEKGLLFVAIYFAFNSMGGGVDAVITLPWFKATFSNGEYIYMSVFGFIVLGRSLGGFLHYKIKLPTKYKFAIALAVYVVLNILEGSYLYTPLWIMRIMCFAIGIMGVTSYTIRISGTQSYVPNERRGRFNGAFLMMNTIGSLTGELAAGAALTVMPMRPVLSLFMAVVLVAAIIFIWGGRKHIRPIYNTEA